MALSELLYRFLILTLILGIFRTIFIYLFIFYINIFQTALKSQGGISSFISLIYVIWGQAVEAGFTPKTDRSHSMGPVHPGSQFKL